MAVTQSSAPALGRKSDDLVITAMGTTSLNTATDTGSLSVAKLQEGYETLANLDVPMDGGDIYWAISPFGWIDLLNVDDFANADYVGNENLPLPGAMTMKVFMGVKVYQHTGLTNAKTSGAVVDCPLYHTIAVGHASGAEISMDMTWQGKEQAHLAVGSMSQGACLIDGNGVFKVQYTNA